MINIAELLKDCPKGTKLYSPLFGEVFLYTILSESKFITVRTADSITTFNEFGQWGDNSRLERFPDAECLLFPSKDCRTWEGWKLPVEPKFKVGDWIACIDDDGDVATEKIVCFMHNKVLLVDIDGCFTEYPKTELSNFHLWSIPDAKDGDVLVLNGKPFIYSPKYGKNYCYIDNCGQFRVNFSLVFEGNCVLPATKEQSALLFQKMEEVGYEWDADKKELRKIQPHYDIANFKPFDKVLVRFCDGANWCCALFSHYCTRGNCHFVCSGGSVTQCIPFNDDTKHLLGTTDPCDEQYINW